MAIEIVEAYESRQWKMGGNPYVEFLYITTGSDDDLELKQFMLANTPTSYDGLPRIEIEPEKKITNEWYLIRVLYGPPKPSGPPQTGESLYSFDTTGGTQHITQSLETIGAFAAPGAQPPDFKGAIGVTADSVQGVDIVVPQGAWSETHYIPASLVTPTLRRNIRLLTGTVNNAPFKGDGIGEDLFLGASGQRRNDEDWEIRFNFAFSESVTDITIGEDIVVPEKEGWQYLWVLYEETEDTISSRLVKRPVAAYVERVYRYGDFSLLGIGT